MTDQGEAFIKTMGNPGGSDALICEYVGTQLARWIGLPTFDFTIIEFPGNLPVTYPDGCKALPGPAFATRAVDGHTWGGTRGELLLVENPKDIAGIVVFDTWTRNGDRCYQSSRNLGNVFFCYENARPGKHRVLVIDHTECFKKFKSQIPRSIANIDFVKEQALYGLFPEFISYVTRESVKPFIDKLRIFQSRDMAQILHSIPRGWGLQEGVRDSLREFCLQRARFLAGCLEQQLEDACGWPKLLFR